MIKASVIIIVSELDLAGKNMREALLDIHNFENKQFITPPNHWPDGEYSLMRDKNRAICILNIPESQIFIDYMKEDLDAKLIIFASKHSSASGRKAVLVHTTGNWNKTDINSGKDFSLAYAPAFGLSLGYNKLKQYAKEDALNDYWVGLECTHHGPTELNSPVIFMEAGGTENEWGDKKATRVVAKAILAVAKSYIEGFEEEKTVMIGLGGGHYIPSFIKRLEAGLFYIGHSIPKHHHKEIDEQMLVQAYEKTLGQKKIFLIDKKGSRGSDRRRFIEIFEKYDYDWGLTTKYPTKEKKQ